MTVVDQFGVPVAGARVYGVFNAPNNREKKGDTGAGGVVVILSNGTQDPPLDWCFTVTDVTLSGATYDPSANAVTTACESGPQ